MMDDFFTPPLYTIDLGKKDISGLVVFALSAMVASWASASRRHVQDALRRSVDITISSLRLVALAPVMLIVAAAVKLDSKGPVLFQHVRTGRNLFDGGPAGRNLSDVPHDVAYGPTAYQFTGGVLAHAQHGRRVAPCQHGEEVAIIDQKMMFR